MRTIQNPKSGERSYELRQGQLPAVKIRLYKRIPKGYVVDEHQGSAPKGHTWVRTEKSYSDDGYHVALLKYPPKKNKKSAKKPAVKPTAAKRTTAATAARPQAAKSSKSATVRKPTAAKRPTAAKKPAVRRAAR